MASEWTSWLLFERPRPTAQAAIQKSPESANFGGSFHRAAQLGFDNFTRG
jgi:hypothetical protein